MKAIRFRERVDETLLKIALFDGMGGSEKPEDFSMLIQCDNKVGFAGFRERGALTKLLGFEKVSGSRNWVDSKIVKDTIEGAVGKCIRTAPLREISVFVFPTKDDFIRKRMSGVSGSCFWKNTVLVFVHEDFDINDLSRTVIHEFAHAYSLNHMKRETLRDDVVFEGMAENFVLSIMGGKKSPWAIALKRDESMNIFRELKVKMNSRSRSLYRRVFFGGGKYPLWAGYSVGYHLVSDYLKKAGDMEWSELLKKDTAEIIEKSGWL